MGYDDNGGRVSRQYDSAGAKKFLTDYSNPTGYSQVVAELDAAGANAEKEFIYGDTLLSQYDSTNGLAFFHGDNLGSTRLLTGGGGSAISGGTYDYEPYGEPLGSPSSLTNHRFTGQWRDSDLGLQYHRARWLNPLAGHWLSSDPVLDWPSNYGNCYSYCGANPTCGSDPTGMCDMLEVASVLGTISTLTRMALWGVESIQDALGVSLIASQSAESIRSILDFVDLVTTPFDIMGGYKLIAKKLAEGGGLKSLGTIFSAFRPGGVFAQFGIESVHMVASAGQAIGKAIVHIPELAKIPEKYYKVAILISELTQEAHILVHTKDWARMRALFPDVKAINVLEEATCDPSKYWRIPMEVGNVIHGMVFDKLRKLRINNKELRELITGVNEAWGAGRPDIVLEGSHVLDITGAKSIGKAFANYGELAESAVDIAYDSIDIAHFIH